MFLNSVGSERIGDDGVAIRQGYLGTVKRKGRIGQAKPTSTASHLYSTVWVMSPRAGKGFICNHCYRSINNRVSLDYRSPDFPGVRCRESRQKAAARGRAVLMACGQPKATLNLRLRRDFKSVIHFNPTVANGR
jgi:hypothetical protein